MTTIESVMEYTARGWSIIPIPRGKKYPDIPWDGFQTRRATDDELRQWFDGTKYTGMAVVLGPVSGELAARDYDIGASYDEWAEKYSHCAQSFPTVRTHRGVHVYFHLSPESRFAKSPDAYIGYQDGELRLSRCICLLPPSAHPDGGCYEWIYQPDEIPEIDPEEYGLTGVLKTTPVRQKEGNNAELIIEPGRNTALCEIAGAMRRKGMQEDEIAAALHVINSKRVRPPLPGEEVDAIAKSMCRYSPADPPQNGNSTRPTIVCMADIEPEAVGWLWQPYLPKGKLTILEGDPSVGKTTLALQIAAIITQGYGFPDVNHNGDGKPGPAVTKGNILYLNAEDGLADTLRPRLDRAGADCSRVFVMTGLRITESAKITERMVTLQDIVALEITVNEFTPSLIIIDPIQAYMGRGVDMNKAGDTRPVLAAVAQLAEKYRVAILVIRHFSKGKQTKAIYQGLGSIDISAAARSILRVDREKDEPTRRIICQTKCSCAPEGESLTFELMDGFKWTGISTVSADDMNQDDDNEKDSLALGKAIEYLETKLNQGSLPASLIQQDARRQRVSDYSLRRAKKKLRIISTKLGDMWMWALPDK